MARESPPEEQQPSCQLGLLPGVFQMACARDEEIRSAPILRVSYGMPEGHCPFGRLLDSITVR